MKIPSQHASYYLGVATLHPYSNDAGRSRQHLASPDWAASCSVAQVSSQLLGAPDWTTNDSVSGVLGTQPELTTQASQDRPCTWARHCVGVHCVADAISADTTTLDLLAELGLGRYVDGMLTRFRDSGQPQLQAQPQAPVQVQVQARAQPRVVTWSSADTASRSGEATGRWLGRENNNPVTPKVLKAWIELGADGIRDAGGASAVAASFGIPLSTIFNYVRVSGRLTPLGERLLNLHGNYLYSPITPEILQRMIDLGRPGIMRSGGFLAFAKRHDLCASTLRHYIQPDGYLSERGKALMRQTKVLGTSKGGTPGATDIHTANSRLINDLGLGHYLDDGSAAPDTREALTARLAHLTTSRCTPAEDCAQGHSHIGR